MSNHALSRRDVLKGIAVTAAMAGSSVAAAKAKAVPHLAGNQYPWLTYFGREKRDFNADLKASFKDIADSGLDGFEPLSSGSQQIDQYISLLKANGLQMKSLYVNSTLHDPDQLKNSIDQVLDIAKSAKNIGTKLVVLNPSPVKWGVHCPYMSRPDVLTCPCSLPCL